MVEPYKAQFIQFLLDSNALKIGGPFQLRSGRLSPYFINIGDINDGVGLTALGNAYADTILTSIGPDAFDGVFGIPEKANIFGPSISIALADRGHNKRYSTYRKGGAKAYGEATTSSADEAEKRQKEHLLGARIQKGSRQVLVDDVMTAGDAKIEALRMLRYLTEDVAVPALVIAVNRQEIGEFGENAIEAFTRDYEIPVFSTITACNIFDYLKETGKISPEDERVLLTYIRAWGTPEIRQSYGLVSKPLIEGRSVIPACDTDSLERFEKVVAGTADLKGIGGYKIGFELGLRYGLPKVVEVARRLAPDKVIIYDHQKAGTDIGDVQMARKFARTNKGAGIDAVIFFPQSGPVTQTAWTGEALQAGLEVIIGGHMTHRGYLESSGGYIRDTAPAEIYSRAAAHGISNFVVPGNDPAAVGLYKDLLLGLGVSSPTFFAPGFISQGGNITEAGKSAGDNFHAIVGRDLMNAEDIRAKAEELTSQLVY